MIKEKDMDDSIFQCLEHAQAQYKERAERRLQSYAQDCQSQIPSFLNAVRATVTAESMERHHGAVFVPIQKGCFPTFAKALSEQGVPVKAGITVGLDNCDCMLFMEMTGQMVATSSPLSRSMCERINEEK